MSVETWRGTTKVGQNKTSGLGHNPSESIEYNLSRGERWEVYDQPSNLVGCIEGCVVGRERGCFDGCIEGCALGCIEG